MALAVARHQRAHRIWCIASNTKVLRLEPFGRTQVVVGLFFDQENAFGDIQQLLAVLSELDEPTMTRAKRHAIILLELLELLGDGRLAHPQTFSSLGKAAFHRNR